MTPDLDPITRRMRAWGGSLGRAALIAGLVAAPAPWAWAADAHQALTDAQYTLIERSRRARIEGRLDDAAALLEEARGIHDHPSLILDLGQIRLAQQRCGVARDLLVEAEYHDPWAMPGKDVHERERRSSLGEVHRRCPARLTLTCPDDIEVRLDEAAITCGETLTVDPGVHVLTARASRAGAPRIQPRRIHTRGAEHTTLRLDGPDPSRAWSAWVPTSDQPIPDQDPARTAYNSEAWMGGLMLGFGVLIAGLGATTVALAYDEGDPADNPDPTLTEEEQWDAELRYDRAVAYGWGFGIVGLGMAVVGGLLLPSALESETPGFSMGDGRATWAPMVGPAWGGGLRFEF